MTDIPEPYRSIKDLPYNNHGWFNNRNFFEEWFVVRSANTIIEVGSWLGKSTCFLAQNLPEGGKLYAVDTWLGSVEHANDPRVPTLFQQFCSNVKHEKLTHKIVPIRMKSLEAAAALNIMADLIYIDASHEEQDVYEDIMAWSSHLAPNGFMCGDDWNWDSVKRGVLRAALDLGVQAHHQLNFWWLVSEG